MKTQFETWYEQKGKLFKHEEACRVAWANGAYCEKEHAIMQRIVTKDNLDDDLNEPLGKACQLGDVDCEGCQ